MHRCLSCRNGFVMRSPGSWLGGSRVSALRLFCLAPLGHLVNVWLLAVASWMTCSGRGTQVAWSLRLITALNMSFHRDSLVLVLFCLCVCVFCLFFLVVVLLLACVFLVAVFFFSHRGIISLACTTNQKLITASASIAEFTQRVNTCITTLREQLRRWSKKKCLKSNVSFRHRVQEIQLADDHIQAMYDGFLV